MTNIVTNTQFRAARAWLGWTASEAAEKASLSKNTVASIEAGKTTHASSITLLRTAYENAGIVFLDSPPGIAFVSQ